MKKTTIAIALSLLAACGGESGESGTKPPPVKPPVKPGTPEKTPPAQKPPDEKKVKHVDERGVSKSAEAYDTYVEAMESMQKEMKGIQKAIDEDKGEAVIKAHLKKLGELATKADEADYLKDPEENEKLDDMFNIFINVRINQLVGAAWDKDNYEDQFGRLKQACSTCHQLFREDE